MQIQRTKNCHSFLSFIPFVFPLAHLSLFSFQCFNFFVTRCKTATKMPFVNSLNSLWDLRPVLELALSLKYVCCHSLFVMLLCSFQCYVLSRAWARQNGQHLNSLCMSLLPAVVDTCDCCLYSVSKINGTFSALIAHCLPWFESETVTDVRSSSQWYWSVSVCGPTKTTQTLPWFELLIHLIWGSSTEWSH